MLNLCKSKSTLTVIISVFLLTALITPADAVDLPFDPDDYSFLVYDPGNNYDFTKDAMDYLGIPYTLRDSDNEVTANDLATHDILIVGENAGGNVTGLDDEDLAEGITGRIILTGHDLDQHTVEGIAAAETMFIQAIDWVLKDGGTGLIALACNNEEPYPYLPAGWGIIPESKAGNNVNEFTLAGLVSGVYDGLEPDQFDDWTDSYHNTFTIGSNSSFVSFELGGDDDIITVAGILSGPELTKTDDVNDGNCVSPGDKITYTITYKANGDSGSNVVITDYLPVEVDPIISIFDSNYNEELHRYTWQIGELSADANDFVTLEVIVNEFAEPLGTITNYCEIEGDQYCSFTTSVTNTCWWVDVIYADEDANGCNCGTSWKNAYLDLQDAIRQAGAGRGSQIRVENKNKFFLQFLRKVL